MVNILGIGAVTIHSPDPATLALWYDENLGIKCSLSSDEGRYHGRIGSGDHAVQFAIYPLIEQPGLEGSSIMINYKVENLEELLDLLRLRTTPIGETEENEYGKFAYITDPDGNRIELYQELAS